MAAPTPAPSEPQRRRSRDHFLGLRGLGDFEGFAGQQFDERILAVAFGEGAEALLELRKGGFGGSHGAAAGETAQRERQPGGRGDGQHEDDGEARDGDAAVRKGERVGHQDGGQGGQQSGDGDDRHAAQQRAPTQTLFQLPNVCVKLFAETHCPSSRAVRFYCLQDIATGQRDGEGWIAGGDFAEKSPRY